MNKAVFLDKDGTLIKNVPYNVDTEKIEILPQVIGGLKLLQKAGYLLIIVSNQSGIARGYFTEEDLKKAFDHLEELFMNEGLKVEGIYYCPHHLEGKIEKFTRDCNCRKPLTGMFEQAAKEHDIDLSSSWMIGDILDDVEAGHNAGMKTVLINNGNETEWLMNAERKPDVTAETLHEAAHYIVNQTLQREEQKKYEQTTY